MSAQAIARGVRMSPRKVSPVAALVRGRTVADALEILDHTPRRAALTVRKVIASAAANADYNHGYKPDSLYIAEISVNSGMAYKRWRAVAKGRSLPYQLRTSHIKVVVDGDKREVKKPVAAKKTTATTAKTAPKTKEEKK